MTPENTNSNDSAKSFRRLKWNELVTSGDFISDGNRGFELWDGPAGFRADAFLKPIYRKRDAVQVSS